MKLFIYTAIVMGACAVSKALPARAATMVLLTPQPNDPSNGPVHVVNLAQNATVQCPNRKYTYDDVYMAAAWGMKLQEAGVGRGLQSTAHPKGAFPHPFNTTLIDFGKDCPADGNRQEYVLLQNNTYNGGPKDVHFGDDRVVYYHKAGDVAADGHALGYYCGAISHASDKQDSTRVVLTICS